MPASASARPTIIAKIVGRLGNQLFSYAAARGMALLGGADLCLDINFFRSDIYFGREYRLDASPPGPAKPPAADTATAENCRYILDLIN